MKIYRAVGNRIAVEFEKLKLPIPPGRAFTILAAQGFYPIEVNLETLALNQIGKALYKRGARFDQAPHIVDCSMFVKWLYAQKGIWLPRHSIDQREYGRAAHTPKPFDLIFQEGHKSYYWHNPKDNVGHVGIITTRQTIVHASGSKYNVIETPLQNWLGPKFRGFRRYMPAYKKIFTFEMTKRKVETSQELRWIILQNLTRGV